MARLLISLRKQKQLKENFLILTPLSLPVCLPIICYSGSVDGWHVCAPKTPIVFCFPSFSFLFCIIKLFLSDYFSSGTKYALVFPIIGEQAFLDSCIPIKLLPYFSALFQNQILQELPVLTVRTSSPFTCVEALRPALSSLPAGSLELLLVRSLWTRGLLPSVWKCCWVLMASWLTLCHAQLTCVAVIPGDFFVCRTSKCFDWGEFDILF